MSLSQNDSAEQFGIGAVRHRPQGLLTSLHFDLSISPLLLSAFLVPRVSEDNFNPLEWGISLQQVK